MLSAILSWLAHTIIWVISSTKYVGVFLLMLLDSFNIPIPSEVTMPFSGFLAAQGTLSFWLVVCAGTIGSYVGSVCSYFLADRLIANRNKLFLHLILHDAFLQKAAAWFQKYGSVSIFFGRCIPVIRTFISLPAGLGKVPFKKFTYLTLGGSFIWTLALTYIGWTLGEHWERIGDYIHRFDAIILILLLAGLVWLIYRHRVSGKLERKGIE